MVDVSNYYFNIIMAKTAKPEESFMNSHVNECLSSKSAISATRRMCMILDAEHEKEDLNKVTTQQFQRLNTKERKRVLNQLRKL